ncbi:MAG: hypothetical protein WBG73_23120, partial [Coleofasciculaceae cyanobacterium]
MILNKPKLRQLLTILVSLSTLGIVVMNSDFSNAQNSPNNPQFPDRQLPVGPFIPPEQGIFYNPISSP